MQDYVNVDSIDNASIAKEQENITSRVEPPSRRNIVSMESTHRKFNETADETLNFNKSIFAKEQDLHSKDDEHNYIF